MPFLAQGGTSCEQHCSMSQAVVQLRFMLGQGDSDHHEDHWRVPERRNH